MTLTNTTILLCSILPELIQLEGAPWPVLPPGIYDVTFEEIEERYVTNDRRRALFNGFKQVANALHCAGCPTVYLDGSFVTAKPHPGDYDRCWEPEGINYSLLDPVLSQFGDRSEAQKQKYLGEMFPAKLNTSSDMSFLELLQIEQFSGLPKGILRIRP